MNILYYGEPDIAHGGGVGKVAYYLPEALKKKIGVDRFDGINKNGSPKDLLYILNDFFNRKYSIIHFNAGPSWKNGGLALLKCAKRRKIGTILNIHGIPPLERIAEQSSQPYSFFDWVTALSNSKSSDRIVVNSNFMRQNVIKWHRVVSNKVVVIPNGVDFNTFGNNAERLLSLEGEPSILFVGHLSRLKGVDILIRSVTFLKREFPRIKLHLVGGGNVPYYIDFAKKLGVADQIIIHGWANQSMVAKYYGSADICVFPSRHEGFGIVVLEAMASRVPVIASDIPSFSEIISSGIDGRLFCSESSEGLAREINTLSNDNRLRKKLVDNGYKKALNYSWDNIADKYISLYASLN